MMKTYSWLILTLLALFSLACDDDLKIPNSNGPILVIDTVIVPDTLILEGDDYNRSLIWYNRDTLLVPRGLPDFTDDGLSVFMNNNGSPSSHLVNSCVIPSLHTFFEAANGGPASGYTFVAPNRYQPIPPQCTNGISVNWHMTPNQRYIWSATQPHIRHLLTNALSLYAAALDVPGTSSFPIYVSGLQYQVVTMLPYTGVNLTMFMSSEGVNLYWVINLEQGIP